MLKKWTIYFKILKGIYPLTLVLLIVYPILVGFYIDYDLSDSREFIVNLIWLPFFTITFLFFQKRIIYILVSFLYFTSGLISLFHWLILKGPVTITSLLVLSNTNLNEALEYFTLKSSLSLFFSIPYFIIFIIHLKNRKNIEIINPIHSYIASIVILISLIFISENAFHNRLIRKGSPQLVEVTASFFNEIKMFNDFHKHTFPKKIEAYTRNKTQTFVLILGESVNRNHMSIYGYKRKTNPLLEDRNDIHKFNNTVSPYSNTIYSVLSMLSESNLDNKTSFSNNIDIIDVFHAAGFKTYWLSNQSPIGIWDNAVTSFAKKSDYIKFVNISSNSSFDATLNASYDSKLFQPFISALTDSVSKKIIVIHLMGSHSSYKKRYPSNFSIFKGNTSKEEIISNYDNSILFNDFIVDSLFNAIKYKSKNISSAIYIADHGENVYDEKDYAGHNYTHKLPNSNVEIPFLVWLSPQFLTNYSFKLKSIQKNINQSFLSDDLFHSIIDLNEIKTPILDKTKSIFNEKFNISRIRTLEDGKLYKKNN